ncbi:hepatic leukemia factor [Anabrus simplex]|uniref:hepatic leukemia factor n=1 Tax=Anabrus simplex TaxID=316456 RepID=UPI0034DDC392
MGTHVMSAYSALHLLRSYNHLLGPPGESPLPYQQLVAPRPPPDFTPLSSEVTPFTPFVSPHGLLGSYQPLPPLLPLIPDSKTSCSPPALGSCPPCKRPRGEKKPIPEELKDDKYYERRKRNNQAAKKSRDARKLREDQIALRATILEHENAILRAQVLTLREEAQSLRHLLLQRKVEMERTT